MASKKINQDAERLYAKVCKVLKQYGEIPSREDFNIFLRKFNELKEGHKELLAAIGNL